jgi:hypothetical protein
MSVILPQRFYGDPAECVDELRKIHEQQKRKADRTRIYKGQRIRALVKQVMKGVRR